MNPMLQLVNVTLQQAKDKGYDCVQFKYRGPTVTNTLDGVNLIGNALPDVTFFWDCLSSHGAPAKAFSYRDRYALTFLQTQKMGNPGFVTVRSYPIDSAKDLWSKLDATLHCGLIFRRSHGIWDDEILCQRWYPEVPKELE